MYRIRAHVRMKAKAEAPASLRNALVSNVGETFLR